MNIPQYFICFFYDSFVKPIRIFIGLLFLFLLVAPFSSFSQADCSNIGFQNNSTNGWILSHGTFTDNGTKSVFGPEIVGAGFQVIMNKNQGNDPNIKKEVIPVVPSGSNYAIRLGDMKAGGKYDRIKTTFVVSQNNSLFQYQFAVVLQNMVTGIGFLQVHQPFQKPGFSLQITDKNGTVLSCGSFDVQLGVGTITSNLSTENTLEYRNWTTGAIDLRNYIGQTINLQVTVYGCSQQIHFGYAYFTAQCQKAEIKQLTPCPDANGNITLKAPDGFGSYRWDTGETTSTIQVKAKIGDNHRVILSPISSLNTNCIYTLNYIVTKQTGTSTINKTICQGESYQLGNISYNKTGKYTYKVAGGTAFCDSIVTLNLVVNKVVNYTHPTVTICEGTSFMVGDSVFKKAGKYITHISRPAQCDSIVTITIKTEKSKVSVLTKNFQIDLGDSIKLGATLLSSGTIFSYQWTPPETVTCPTCLITYAKPNESTTYIITANDNSKTCISSDTVHVQVASCGIYIPNAFTPNGDLLNPVFFVYGKSCVKMINEMLIFNRWGEIVFQKQNFPASDRSFGWDGTYNGVALETGVYTYKILVEIKNGTIREYAGTVSILR